MKKVLINYSSTKLVCLLVDHVDEVYDKANETFRRFKCTVYSTEIVVSEDGVTKEIRFIITAPKTEESFQYLKTKLRNIEGVKGQHIE